MTNLALFAAVPWNLSSEGDSAAATHTQAVSAFSRSTGQEEEIEQAGKQRRHVWVSVTTNRDLSGSNRPRGCERLGILGGCRAVFHANSPQPESSDPRWEEC